MKKLLKKIPCPKCGSSRTPALQLYEQDDGRVTGFCFSCDTYFPNPTGKNKFTKEEDIDTEKVTSILYGLKSKAIPDRKLRKEIVEKYGIKLEFDSQTRDIIKHYYPYYSDKGLSGYKVRLIKDKEFYAIGNISNCKLFGQQLFENTKKKVAIAITEGECDALATYQMLLDKGKSIPVVSVNTGANINSIRKNYEFLADFKYIYLVFDQDDPGKRLTEEVAKLFDPGQCRIVRFTEKDPCDMLVKGKEEEFLQAFKDATAFRPDGVITVDTILEEVLEDPKIGLSFPWPSLTEVTFGYRRKELHGLGASAGAGKSSAFKELAHHIISEHNLPVGLIFLEEPPARTLKELVGKFMNKVIHVPNAEYDKDEAKKILKTIKDKVYLYNHFGAKDWETIKSIIKYYVRSLGIKDIFLDHLTALVAQEDDEYRALNKIMEELAGLTQALDCTIFYVSHLRKAQGVPHEEGGRVSMNQFRGSGAIAFWSHFMYGLERNQQADSDDERNTVTLRVLKDRNTGLATGKIITLKYNHDTGRLLEDQEQQPF